MPGLFHKEANGALLLQVVDGLMLEVERMAFRLAAGEAEIERLRRRLAAIEAEAEVAPR